MADEIDTWEDVLAEEIAELRPGISPAMERIVVELAASGLRKAEEKGRLRELFGAGAVRNEDLHELMARLISRIDGDKNPALEAECVDYVLGLGINGGETQTKIARRHGVGRACVSARCIALREHLGRPPARGMKSDAARESYRKRQLGKRARPRADKWGFGGILNGIFGGETAHGIA